MKLSPKQKIYLAVATVYIGSIIGLYLQVNAISVILAGLSGIAMVLLTTDWFGNLIARKWNVRN